MQIKDLKNLLKILALLVISQPSLQSQDFKTVGYLPTYRFGLIDNIELERLTHLNIAFAHPDANGYLTTGGGDIGAIVEQAHDAGLEVFIALAGGSSVLSDWEDWLTPANRPFLIHNIINYTLGNDLQGIDVDLEWGNVNDDYSGFVIELRDSVDQHNLQLSVALPGTHRYPEVNDEALFSFDWINLMVYDLTGPWAPNNPGPHSPYSFAVNSINFWAGHGVEKSKMTLGMPFYGYDFTDQTNVVSRRYSDLIAIDPTYSELDQVGQIYYNGLPTIEQKTTLALNELSGVMIWELGQDSFDEYSLLKRIDETISDYQSTAIHEVSQSNIAAVYPNPAADFVHLKLNKSQNITITLLSTQQKVLKTEAFYHQEMISFNIDEIPNGMYFLFVEGAGFRKTIKLAVI